MEIDSDWSHKRERRKAVDIDRGGKPSSVHQSVSPVIHGKHENILGSSAGGAEAPVALRLPCM